MGLGRTHIIASASMKGGVGKTHTCWTLAAVCQERGKRCLIVDLDQQANITQSFIPDHIDPTGVEQIFDPEADPDPQKLVHRTQYDYIDIIPVTGHFARYDLSQPELWQEGCMQRVLYDVLQSVASSYDYIFIDTPPRISLATISAFCAADYVVVPMEAADWGARGTPAIRGTIEEVQKHDNPDLRLLGYVISKFKRRRQYQLAYKSEITTSFEADCFDTVIPDLAEYEKAVTEATPITIHSPSSHAANIARQFFDEIEARIQEKHTADSRSQSTASTHQNAATVAG